MMAGLFGIFAAAIAAIGLRQRLLGIALISIGLVMSLLMFWYHATDMLQINW